MPRVSKGVVNSARKCAREPFGEESGGEEGGCKDASVGGRRGAGGEG